MCKLSWDVTFASHTFYFMSIVMRKPDFAYAKSKVQMTVTAQLISIFVFASL